MGWPPARIRHFERQGVAITAYGVGSSLLGHQGSSDGVLYNFDFTGDVVDVERSTGKQGGAHVPPQSSPGARGLGMDLLGGGLVRRLNTGTRPFTPG